MVSSFFIINEEIVYYYTNNQGDLGMSHAKFVGYVDYQGNRDFCSIALDNDSRQFKTVRIKDIRRLIDHLANKVRKQIGLQFQNFV